VRVCTTKYTSSLSLHALHSLHVFFSTLSRQLFGAGGLLQVREKYRFTIEEPLLQERSWRMLQEATEAEATKADASEASGASGASENTEITALPMPAHLRLMQNSSDSTDSTDSVASVGVGVVVRGALEALRTVENSPYASPEAMDLLACLFT
jgi:hypothetical protein